MFYTLLGAYLLAGALVAHTVNNNRQKTYEDDSFIFWMLFWPIVAVWWIFERLTR